MGQSQKMITIYKIRDKNTGLYSSGIMNNYWSKDKKETKVTSWTKKGKEWNSEKLVKDHLMKCIKLYGIPESWEIMEFTQQPSKEINDWVDAEMLIQLLKTNRNKNQ